MGDIDRFRGCLVGGAAGDALGYAVEFMREEDIISCYGGRGIAEYELDAEGAARFSDDTQMTLFTADGLLLAAAQDVLYGAEPPYVSYVAACYCDWYRTQTEDYPLAGEKHGAAQGPAHGAARPYLRSRLLDVPELFAMRAPGTTCLSACAAGCTGTPERPINQSKGCGGVMRVAPVGLYLDPKDDANSGGHARVQRLGAECAALTHGHELGWLPAGALAHVVGLLAHDPGRRVREAVEDAMRLLPEAYPQARHAGELQALVGRAIALADTRASDLDCIHELGEGWVAEETLAIAVLCALRHEEDFEGALVAAVNHNGDSDSTGAVCGNILGARLGAAAIPAKFTDRLELLDLILRMADELCSGEK